MQENNLLEMATENKYLIIDGSYESLDKNRSLFLTEISPLDKENFLDFFGIDENSKIKENAPLTFTIKTSGSIFVEKGILNIKLEESTSPTNLSKIEEEYLEYINEYSIKLLKAIDNDNITVFLETLLYGFKLNENSIKLLKAIDNDNITVFLEKLLYGFKHKKEDLMKLTNMNRVIENKIKNFLIVEQNLIIQVDSIDCFYKNGSLACILNFSTINKDLIINEDS